MPRRTTTPELDELLAQGDFVRALARSLIRDPGRADDVAQDTFVAALEHPPRRSEGTGTLRSWLATVLRNFARQAERRESRSRGREERSARPEGVPSTAEVIQREATRRTVVETVLALDEAYRDALLLRYYDDLPPRAIARRLGVPVETVRTRLRRGLVRLRAGLDAERPGGREAWAVALAPLAAGPRAGSPPIPPIVRYAAGFGLGVAATGLAVWWIGGASAVERDPDTSPGVVASEPLGASTLPGSSAAVIVPILDSPARVSVPQPATIPPVRASEPTAEPVTGEVRYALVPPERRIAGRVVDERDQPVAGALVYVGNQIRARGDEPFKPFQERRIPDGVRTDGAGQFELAGRSRVVTVWQEEFGAVTVPWERAERVVLHDRVDLRGRLVDGEGNPLPAKKVVLDRNADETTTVADGSFVLERVAVGSHGLWIDDSPYFGVDLPPGGREPFEMVWSAGRTKIELRSGAEPFLEKVYGAWLGLDAGLPILELRAEGGSGAVSDLAAGRYLLLLPGARAIGVDVPENAETLSVDLGSAELTVRGPAGTRVYLLPAGSSGFAQLMAGRVCSTAIPEGGELRLTELGEGRYEIGVDREGILGPVEIGPDGSTVVLE